MGVRIGKGRATGREESPSHRELQPSWLERHKQVEKLQLGFLVIQRAVSLEKHTGV